MTKVKIPFLPEFKEQLLKGIKTATTRTRKYGDNEDTFTAYGAKFRITKTIKLTLGAIAYTFHKEEGFQTPQGFIDVWNRIHPRRGYRPDDMQFIHFFMRTDKGLGER